MNIATLAGSLEECSGMWSTLIFLVLFSSFPFSNTKKTCVGGDFLSANANFFLFLLLDMFVLLAVMLPFKAPSWKSRQLG